MNPSNLTEAKLAEVMNISVPALQFMATHPEASFRPTEQRKDEKGKVREIDPPTDIAKKRFKKLHGFWQKEFVPHSMAHGGVRRKSHFTSARQHLGRKFVVSRDLSNCYNSISKEQLQTALRRNGFEPSIAWLLASLFTVHGRVPQGSPISGDALNEYLRHLDHVLASQTGRSDAGRSRLTDDIVISTDEIHQADSFANLIEEQIQLVGLNINEKKREENGLQTSAAVQEVHSLVVNSKRGTCVTKAYARDAVEAANQYREQAKIVSPSTLEALAARRMIITGHMFNCRQAEVSPARELRRQLEAGDRYVFRKLMKVGLLAHRKNWWIASSTMDPARLSQLWLDRLNSGVYGVASGAVPTVSRASSSRTGISPFVAARLRSMISSRLGQRKFTVPSIGKHG